ncbi:hypothetical protein G6F57_021554 [Rhizopus arrhizus]|nr:hypothetical protein G6F57_021554 [Rhizopus arrhizus]
MLARWWGCAVPASVRAGRRLVGGGLHGAQHRSGHRAWRAGLAAGGRSGDRGRGVHRHAGGRAGRLPGRALGRAPDARDRDLPDHSQLFVRHCAGGDLPAVFRFGDYCRGAGELAADRPAGARRVHAGQVQRVRRGRHGAGLFAHAHRVCRSPA